MIECKNITKCNMKADSMQQSIRGNTELKQGSKIYSEQFSRLCEATKVIVTLTGCKKNMTLSGPKTMTINACWVPHYKATYTLMSYSLALPWPMYISTKCTEKLSSSLLLFCRRQLVLDMLWDNVKLGELHRV
jgi:hypothetical protein